MTTRTRLPDYYAILGVPADATMAQIKKAYRKLARQHHPDTNPGDTDAADRFKAITEAYEVLTDPARRQAYDATRPPVTSTTLTTPSPDGPAISAVVRVLEDTWSAIRARHGEVPAVVIIIASGTDRKQPVWGHHAPGRWHTGHGQRAEIMISGEGLGRTPHDVLGTLLHEAAHALAAARGIKDTSRQGRYHNTKYKMLAEELGITVTFDPAIGWSITSRPRPHRRGLRQPAGRPASRHDPVADQRRTVPHPAAQLQPDRCHLPLWPQHPRRRLHPRRGPHHLHRLRRALHAQER